MSIEGKKTRFIYALKSYYYIVKLLYIQYDGRV